MEGHGGKYNHTLYNAISWMILTLHIIHYLFDLSVNGLLRKMRFKEYVRIRLRRSLWYFGFYACSFLYCSATCWKNEITLPNRYTFYMLDLTEPISDHLLIGYALLSAFYASSSIWEGCQCSFSSFSYLFLTGFTAFTYCLRYIELAIIFTNTFSVIYIITELIRCALCIIKYQSSSQLFIKSLFFILLSTFIIIYILIIPINFLLPLAHGYLNNRSSIIMVGLNVSMWGWLICEVYSSPLYRLIQHHWYHKNQNKVPECLGSTAECAFFLPRDDDAYKLKIIKQEIKERQDEVMALRKPKKKASIFLQTLKCVATLNRKVKFRKQKKAEDNCNSLIVSKVESEVCTVVADLDKPEAVDTIDDDQLAHACLLNEDNEIKTDSVTNNSEML